MTVFGELMTVEKKWLTPKKATQGPVIIEDHDFIGQKMNNGTGSAHLNNRIGQTVARPKGGHMLYDFVVKEELERLRRAELEKEERPYLELPLHMPYWPDEPVAQEEEETESERGVIIIQM